MLVYGTGIRRIYDTYRDFDIEPEIAVTENTFKIVLPNMNFRGDNLDNNKKSNDSKAYNITAQMQEVLDYLAQYGSLTEDELMDLLNIKKTRAYIIGKQMADMELVDILGRGKDKKYTLRK